MSDSAKTPLLSNRLYDILVWVTTIVLPASATLYFTLAQIWGLPNAEKVVGSIVAVTVFLGVLLKISNNSYNNSDTKYDGKLLVFTDDPEKDVYRLDLNVPIDEIAGKKELTLKVADSS